MLSNKAKVWWRSGDLSSWSVVGVKEEASQEEHVTLRFRAKMRLGKLREPTVFNRQATEYSTVNKTGRTVTLGEGNDFLLQ